MGISLYDFMQRAILAVIAISIFSPILGLFLILRRGSSEYYVESRVLAGVAVGFSWDNQPLG